VSREFFSLLSCFFVRFSPVARWSWPRFAPQIHHLILFVFSICRAPAEMHVLTRPHTLGPLFFLCCRVWVAARTASLFMCADPPSFPFLRPTRNCGGQDVTPRPHGRIPNCPLCNGVKVFPISRVWSRTNLIFFFSVFFLLSLR